MKITALLLSAVVLVVSACAPQPPSGTSAPYGPYESGWVGEVQMGVYSSCLFESGHTALKIATTHPVYVRVVVGGQNFWQAETVSGNVFWPVHDGSVVEYAAITSLLEPGTCFTVTLEDHQGAGEFLYWVRPVVP